MDGRSFNFASSIINTEHYISYFNYIINMSDTELDEDNADIYTGGYTIICPTIKSIIISIILIIAQHNKAGDM